MSDFDPTFATAGEIAAAVRTRRISSRDLVRETFDRIDRHNPTLNAIIWQDPETAMARAEAADEVAPVGRTAAGHARGHADRSPNVGGRNVHRICRHAV